MTTIHARQIQLKEWENKESNIYSF